MEIHFNPESVAFCIVHSDFSIEILILILVIHLFFLNNYRTLSELVWMPQFAAGVPGYQFILIVLFYCKLKKFVKHSLDILNLISKDN